MPTAIYLSRFCPIRRGGSEYGLTIENAKRDGVDVVECEAGSQQAGQISRARPGRNLQVLVKQKPKAKYKSVALQYEVLLNRKSSTEAKYATLVHELAHLYCGHLGTPNDKWWPDREILGRAVREFEAESVCYLVCTRLGIENPSEQYLSGYLLKDPTGDVPAISFERVMTSAGLIEQMGRERLKLRKEI
jgi:hypothetical protein